MGLFSGTAGKVPVFGEIFKVYTDAFIACDGIVKFIGSDARKIDQFVKSIDINAIIRGINYKSISENFVNQPGTDITTEQIKRIQRTRYRW